jgi:outer membrane biogenesis lipoprotein LolB
METAAFDQGTLEYQVVGTGEPIVVIHGALIADSFRPMLRESVAARLPLHHLLPAWIRGQHARD